MAISELQLPAGVRACTYDAAGQMAQALAVRVAGGGKGQGTVTGPAEAPQDLDPQSAPF